jgi:hypothetical protein
MERAICTNWLEASIMVTMAGRAAETALLGFHYDDRGNRQDKRDIRRLAKMLPARAREEVLEELEIKTKTIVMAMPDSIRRVAEALKRSRSPDQNRIDRIIAALVKAGCSLSAGYALIEQTFIRPECGG